MAKVLSEYIRFNHIIVLYQDLIVFVVTLDLILGSLGKLYSHSHSHHISLHMATMKLSSYIITSSILVLLFLVLPSHPILSVLSLNLQPALDSLYLPSPWFLFPVLIFAWNLPSAWNLHNRNSKDLLLLPYEPSSLASGLQCRKDRSNPGH